MYEYIKGKLVEISAAHTVVENGGIGYFLNISVHTYTQLSKKTDCKLFVESIIREDTYILYGFFEKIERDAFRALISVSGVGANTARMMLSSLSPQELQKAIVSGNVVALKSIKGIGVKTAQRIIIELKDKFGKGLEIADILATEGTKPHNEALSALVMLGFSKALCIKALDKILKKEPDLSVEALIKKALTQL